MASSLAGALCQQLTFGMAILARSTKFTNVRGKRSSELWIVCKCCDENRFYWRCGTSPTLRESLRPPPRGLHKRERSRLPTLTPVQYQGQGCSYFNSKLLTLQDTAGPVHVNACILCRLIQTLQRNAKPCSGKGKP